jgi:hypothetical protein
MATTRESESDGDGSKDAAHTVVSAGLQQLPTHPVSRTVTFDTQEKKCFYCKQDRQRV